MRIIVFSDTHGHFSAMHKIFKRNTSADCFIFLGDGLEELMKIRQLYPDKQILCVSGNCDFTEEYLSTDVAVVGGVKIFFTHGHRHDVRFTNAKVRLKGKELGAKIVLYGHTHCRYYEYIDGIHLLNPGSAAQPRDGLPPSYAFIDITPKGIMCAHVDL